ncbi:Druantia anti-phage system protein DruA [Bathymodiolus japonicus methanotrophic gill symbiont]|uniref:Druantia anti-phage system protein DruA n=1 Tax=Bathymodiolus japonicus methanotrophic gill symbiont TaxID=113269 RepID=UPI001E5F229E|nr:Druantia anti-phage system protein DruA [Bathymodiolus japonicus methanotrophic gill symbiont]
MHLIANNSRFLIIPEQHYPNLASRILSLCERRISLDWQKHFGYPLLLLETFVDPQYFYGTIYRAANWIHVGEARGSSRTSKGYSSTRKPRNRSMCALYHRALELDYHSLFLALIIAMEHPKSC